MMICGARLVFTGTGGFPPIVMNRDVAVEMCLLGIRVVSGGCIDVMEYSLTPGLRIHMLMSGNGETFECATLIERGT